MTHLWSLASLWQVTVISWTTKWGRRSEVSLKFNVIQDYHVASHLSLQVISLPNPHLHSHLIFTDTVYALTFTILADQQPSAKVSPAKTYTRHYFSCWRLCNHESKNTKDVKNREPQKLKHVRYVTGMNTSGHTPNHASTEEGLPLHHVMYTRAGHVLVSMRRRHAPQVCLLAIATLYGSYVYSCLQLWARLDMVHVYFVKVDSLFLLASCLIEENHLLTLWSCGESWWKVTWCEVAHINIAWVCSGKLKTLLLLIIFHLSCIHLFIGVT